MSSVVLVEVGRSVPLWGSSDKSSTVLCRTRVLRPNKESAHAHRIYSRVHKYRFSAQIYSGRVIYISSLIYTGQFTYPWGPQALLYNNMVHYY